MQKIAIFGDIFMDIVSRIPVDIAPEIESSLLETAFFDKAGGSAVHCGIHLKRVGLKPIVIGRVGDDIAGRQIECYLSKKSIDYCIMRDYERSTGRCVIFWNTKEKRTILVDKQNANEFVCESEASSVHDTVDASDAVFLSGYCLKEPNTQRYRFFRDVLSYAVKKNKFVICDLVPHDIWRTLPYSEFKEILDQTDLLISEVTTIRRLLELSTVSIGQMEVENTIAKINEICPNLSLVLRFGENGCENEYIYNSFNPERSLNQKTDFEHAVEKRGYGDLLTAQALVTNFGFLPKYNES